MTQTQAFQTAEDAETYIREFLEEEREGQDNDGDRPTYQDAVTTDVPALEQDIYELLKDFVDHGVDVDDCLALLHLVSWRGAVWFVGKERADQLVAEYLPPSPEQDLEQLIRTIGMGYHPDTPYDGYEPPIYSYTEAEWNAIHARFLETRGPDDDDIYEFGLNIFNEMQAEQRPINGATRTGRDGIQQYWADSLNRWVTIPED